METRTIARAVILVAIGVAISPFTSIPIGIAKINPVQHFVNVIAAILLGPWWATAIALIIGIIRNALATGTLLAFPGGMIGALLAALAYRYSRNIYVGALGLASQLGIAGGIFYVLHHIVVKVGLVLVGGAIEETHGTGRLERLGGIARTNGLLALVFVICALSLAGVPPFSGFYAKLLLIRAGLEAGQPGIVAVSILVSVLTLMSMLKIYTNVFWGGRSEIKPSEIADTKVEACLLKVFQSMTFGASGIECIASCQ